jgi:hypothetical protein
VLAAYQDVLGQEIAPRLTYDEGLYFIDIVTDLEVILTQALQRQFSLRTLLSPYRATKKAFNLLSWEDPLPLLTELTQILRQLPARFITSRARLEE